MNCVHCGSPLDQPGAPAHRCTGSEAEPPPRPVEHTVIYLVRPGEILDQKWRIENRIGQGAMGSVFKGLELKKGGRAVAIKILSPDHCRKPKVLARFEREARLMTTLRHPNIVQLLGVGRQGALPFIVMQYLEGETLADYLKGKGGKLSPVETLSIIRQVCSGLSFVHHHGLVHRDIKPQNIFIGSDGHVTILDLGVVRDKSDPGLTKPGAMVGTPYYMSPEQILGTAEVDRRTDVYALGAVIFELLTGTPPFVADSNFEVLYAHRTLPPPDASLLSSFVPKPVAATINRALAKLPEERQQNASELLADLEAGYCLDDDRTNPGIAFTFPEEGEPIAEKKRLKPRTGNSSAVKSAAPARPRPAPRHDSHPSLEEVPSAEVQLVSPGEHAPRSKGPSVSRAETDLREKRLGEQSTSDSTMGDQSATLIEQGELRIVTTLKGLTTGANVFVDRVPRGTTPTSLRLPVGSHTIRLERTGFKPLEREATVQANEVVLLRLDLSKG